MTNKIYDVESKKHTVFVADDVHGHCQHVGTGEGRKS